MLIIYKFEHKHKFQTHFERWIHTGSKITANQNLVELKKEKNTHVGKSVAVLKIIDETQWKWFYITP